MPRLRAPAPCLALALALSACAPALPPAPAPSPPPPCPEPAVAGALDDLHDAAAHADEARYFAHFAPDAVFLGTDATERWDLPAFRAYAHPYFSQGKGWTYHPLRRAVTFDPGRTLAWFDEDLRGERVGATRGTGVLALRGGRWLVLQYSLTFLVPNERFEAMRAAIDAPPPVPFKVRYHEAYEAATQAASRGELGRARELLAALLPEAKTRPEDDLEFWMHNELTWLRWAEGDLEGARAEVEQARAALDHALLPEVQRAALRLHERWDRAYLALEAAMAAPAAGRARAAAEADRARADYEAIAKPAADHDGLAVLGAFFAARRGDKKRAGEEARRVDAEKDADLQDLYVVALGLEAAGDREGAAKVRAKVCEGAEYLMKPLVVRAMEKEGHRCGR